MSQNPAQALFTHGTSVWYDNISRDLIQSGEIKRLIEEWGVRGLTSNPTIFDNAIRGSSTYDEIIRTAAANNLSIDQTFEEVAVGDIGAAADLLRPVYDSSNGVDGFVSIEVSPMLAANTEGTVNEGRQLFKKLNRPNIMIKVPGTKEGIPAVRALLEDGINVNITLLFSVENYIEVAKTYCEALRARVSKGLPVDKIQSVASFFVSRVDTIIDSRLDKIAEANPAKAAEAKALKGQFGVANCRLAYDAFQGIFYGASFADLKAAGAHAQRPLWASTGTKNPAYSDTIYVDELIGPETVNTMPHATLVAFVDHGKPAASTLTKDVEQAKALPGKLDALGVNVADALNELQVDGVKKFTESFQSLNQAIEKKRA